MDLCHNRASAHDITRGSTDTDSMETCMHPASHLQHCQYKCCVPAFILIGNSSQLHFTISPAKAFNPPSVTTVTGRESTHNISGLSSLFGNILSVMSYQQMDTPLLQPPSSKSLRISQTRPPAVIQGQATTSVDLLQLPPRDPFQDHCCKMSCSGQLLIHRSFSGPPEFSKNNYLAECVFKKTNKSHKTTHTKHMTPIMSE